MTISTHRQAVGVVAIGRNEGDRLRRCLESARPHTNTLVYVDSGSTDGSVEMARSMGASVVELDTSIPFTAARARNAGIDHLREIAPHTRYVQVVDGDCEFAPSWFDNAIVAIERDPQTAIVCGRRRERFPDDSPYNRVTDMEWDTPVGQADACGGDALIRLEAHQAVGGYDDSLIAGEEPEMCLRMRRAGWTIQRIAAEMTLHDAQIVAFGQWWKRSVRSGYAYAEGRAMYGRSPDHYCAREVRSIVAWTLVLPLVALSLSWFTMGASLLLLGGYGLLWFRVRRHRIARGDDPAHCSLYARFVVIGKFAQLLGCVRCWRNRTLGRKGTLIEYKEPHRAAA